MADTAGAQSALVVEALNRVRTSGRLARCPPGVIGEVFEFVITAPVQALIAKRFVITAPIRDPELTVFPELVLGPKAARFFDYRAKDVRGDRSNSRKLLKGAHLPKFCSQSLYFLECLFPLEERVIELTVEPPHHSTFFFGRELLEIGLALFRGENFDPVQLQYSPTAVARFNETLELTLSVSPVD